MISVHFAGKIIELYIQKKSLFFLIRNDFPVFENEEDEILLGSDRSLQ